MIKNASYKIYNSNPWFSTCDTVLQKRPCCFLHWLVPVPEVYKINLSEDSKLSQIPKNATLFMKQSCNVVDQTSVNQVRHEVCPRGNSKWCKTRVPRLNLPNTHHIGPLFVNFNGTQLDLKANTYHWFYMGSYMSSFQVGEFLTNSDCWLSYSPKFGVDS